mmetsp:Transcript_17496/g.43178  ORF Transcript_17496/g.43178 Transcript_17496/m.43178 type:complete len:244 (+) Transcript_17496:291-1022(+)
MEGAGADPLRELHLQVRHGGGGLRDDQQVLRGIPGGAVLRRQRVDRPGRDPVPEARLGGVQAGPREVGRQRAVAVRLALQLPGLHRPAEAARPHHGAGPAPRRAPQPRLPNGHQEDQRRQHLLRVHALPPQRGHRHHRLRCVRDAGQGVPPQADHRRRLGVLAAVRLPPHEGHRGVRGRLPAGRHGAHLGPCGGRHHPVAVRPGRRGHHHHAQVPARPPRRHDLLPQGPEGRGQEGQPRHVRS